MSQADIDWGCVLSYLKLRIPELLEDIPTSLSKYMTRLSDRASFRNTAPPN